MNCVFCGRLINISKHVQLWLSFVYLVVSESGSYNELSLCPLFNKPHKKTKPSTEDRCVSLFFWKITRRTFLSSYQSKSLHWLMFNNFYAGSVPLQRTTTYRQICHWSTNGQGFWNPKTIVAWPNLILSCRETTHIMIYL